MYVPIGDFLNYQKIEPCATRKLRDQLGGIINNIGIARYAILAIEGIVYIEVPVRNFVAIYGYGFFREGFPAIGIGKGEKAYWHKNKWHCKYDENKNECLRVLDVIIEDILFSRLWYRLTAIMLAISLLRKGDKAFSVNGVACDVYNFVACI